MWDWASKTKYEGALIGHTFVARKADDPSVVVDKYTLKPTRIIDCPKRKQKVVVQVPQNAAVSANVQNGETCLDRDAQSDSIRRAEEEGVAIAPPGEGLSSRTAGAGFSGSS